MNAPAPDDASDARVTSRRPKVAAMFLGLPAALRTSLRRALVAALALAVLGTGAMGHAAVLRYLLVIGDNLGVDGSGRARPRLAHAESDAARLFVALREHGRFQASPRSRLVLGGTRAEVLSAIATFAVQVAVDTAQVPDAVVVFTVAYSGHGGRGSLFLADGPLSGLELARAIRAVPAALRIGIFDACASASLSAGLVAEKGMRPTSEPFDLLGDLPDEKLDAEGTIWFFSSDSDQVSIEDPDIGGVFTHFFIEALARAPADRGMADLDAVFKYTRDATAAFARARGVTQTPVRDDRVRRSDTIFFAWRDLRRATVIFGPDVAGHIVLTFGDGLAFAFEKTAGTRVERRYPLGTVDVAITSAGARYRERLELAAGDRVLLAPERDAGPSTMFGRVLRRDGTVKGEVGVAHAFAREEDGLTWKLGPRIIQATGEVVLAPRRVVSLTTRLDVGPWLAELGFGYGWGGRDLERLS